MRKTHATVLSLTLLSLSAAAARAADEGPVFSGFVDTTYNYNTSGADTNVAHSFDDQSNTFDLNMAQLLIQGNPRGDKDVGYTFRLGYGSDADKINGVDASGASVSTGHAALTVEEAYGTWRDSGSKIGVKIGKFVTYEGIEVIESIADPTITRGLLFSYAEPFTHTGALATWQANDKIDLAFGLVNGWDQVRDINHSKTIVGKLGYVDSKCGATVSFLYGPEKADNNADNRFSFDVTGVSHHIDKLDLNAQLNFGQEEKSDVNDPNKSGKWWGLGVQPVYHLDKKLFIGARVEYFATGSSVQLGTAPGTQKASIFTVSVAPGYQVTEHFLARVEARMDHANKQIFDDKNNVANKKNQFVLAAESIFSF